MTRHIRGNEWIAFKTFLIKPAGSIATIDRGARRDMKIRSTTILAVRRDGRTAVAGDGQVTLDTSVIKHQAKKVRRIYNDKIVVGFAGTAADALNLSDRLEGKLERYSGNLMRAAVELARDWRTDKYLRRLEAVMLAVDPVQILLISGNGDVIGASAGCRSDVFDQFIAFIANVEGCHGLTDQGAGRVRHVLESVDREHEGKRARCEGQRVGGSADSRPAARFPTPCADWTDPGSPPQSGN